ncbi:MAG: NAD(P)H-dependent oxidoreductase [Salaquimonas sp.]
MQRKPEILILAGSIRSGSFSQQVADAYASELVMHECDITRITLADYPLPIMDEDLEKEKGVPENAKKLARLFHKHNGVVIVSPEYNGSLPPLLKNAIDWISRVSNDGEKQLKPFKGKWAAIATSSPGVMGGISCIKHLREILTRIGMEVISDQLAVGNAMKAFDNKGHFSDERVRSMHKNACTSLVEKASLLG